jgi:hypothetical protein
VLGISRGWRAPPWPLAPVRKGPGPLAERLGQASASAIFVITASSFFSQKVLQLQVSQFAGAAAPRVVCISICCGLHGIFAPLLFVLRSLGVAVCLVSAMGAGKEPKKRGAPPPIWPPQLRVLRASSTFTNSPLRLLHTYTRVHCTHLSFPSLLSVRAPAARDIARRHLCDHTKNLVPCC